VSHRHDRQQVALSEVNHSIRESSYPLGANDRFTIPAGPYCPRLRRIGTLINGAEYLDLEPVTQTDLAIVVPVDVGLELSLGVRMPLDPHVSALLPRRLTSSATLGKMPKHLFVRNGLDLAAENVIDA